MIGRAAVLAAMLGATMQPALAEGDALADAMARNPERFLAQTVDLIAGFGDSDGLRPAGIEAHVALARAGARAAALRRFHAMDLDADGTIDRAELAVSQRAASAAARGRLERQFTTADADGSGAVEAAEIAAAGQLAALRALGEDEAALLRALMQLDTDGDGALIAAEVERAMAGLGSDT